MTPMGDTAAPTGSGNAFANWLEGNGERLPHKTFVHSVDQDKAITYGEMRGLCRRIGRFLSRRGLGPNDRVALLADNSIEHLAAYLGVMAHGATACTVHIEMNAVYFEEILRALDARIVLYEAGLGVERLAGAVPGEWLCLGSWRPGGGDGFFAAVADMPDTEPLAPVNAPDDVASIFYTSGTDAKPKGVVCRFAELAANTGPTADAFGIAESDRILDYRSFNWMSAQVLGALGPLCRGATLVLARKFSASRFYDWIRDHEVSVAVGNPTVINMLVNRPAQVRGADLPRLRFVTSSSAPLPVAQWKAFERLYGIPVAQGYGTSETGWIAGSSERTRRLGSVGRPHAYHRAAIVDPDGNPLPRGEIGAIEIGGDPDTEYRYLADDGSIRVNAKGRIQTGDVGYLDADGYLYVTGRRKELIIRGGVNVAPVEIDNVVLEMPGIADAATVGVPDGIYGEEVVIYVVAKPGAALTPDAVLAHCADRLPQPKRPKQVILRDALPKTGRGKMDRNALAEDWKTRHPG